MKKVTEQELGQAIELFSMTYQQLSGQLNRRLDAFQLNMTQISILTHFARNPGTSHTVSELAGLMSMNQPGVTKAVSAMVKKSWLLKQKDEHDGRISHLTLTAEGASVLQGAQQGCLPLLQQTLGQIPASELEQFTQTLRSILIGMSGKP